MTATVARFSSLHAKKGAGIPTPFFVVIIRCLRSDHGCDTEGPDTSLNATPGIGHYTADGLGFLQFPTFFTQSTPLWEKKLR